MNLEILILHFENKNCFDVSLKAFAFEILQLLGFFLGKEIICSCSWRYCLWWKYIMRWPSISYGFPKWSAREKAQGFVWEKLISFWTLILSVWIIMSSLLSMLWLLWKSTFCILRVLFIVPGCLLAWLERTSTGT